METRVVLAMEQASAQQDLNKSLLRLTYILQQSMSRPDADSLRLDTHYSDLPKKNSQSAIELLMTQPALLDNLRKALTGNYGVILSLLGCLDHGLQAKKLVDRIIDASAYL